MPQINDIRELAQQNARYVSNSPQDWMSYLDVAARLYRYSFTDALLIHAQRPDATACAELELWNQKMNRWVNRGAKGIALLDDTGPRTKLRYVFDIADTHLVRGGRTPLLWNLDSHEHEQAILDHLADTYGLSQTDSMNAALLELAQQLTADNLDEAMDGLAYEVKDTFLEELDEDNIRVRFRELMTNSIFYTLSRRCGQEPMDVLDDDEFIRIVDFNKLPVLSFLGNAVSEQCEAVLFDIGREMRKIYKKEITQQLEKSVDSLYNTNIDFSTLKRETEEATTKGGQENGVDVLPQGRLSVPESGRAGRAADHREVRDAAQDVPEKESQELVSEYADERQAEPASGADRGSSGEQGGNPAGQPEREVPGTEQGEGPAGMGGAPEQPDSDGRGDRLEGIGVQLTKTTTEQDLSEAEEEIASAFSFPDLPTVEQQIRAIEAPIQARYADEIALDSEVVDEILRTGSNRSKGQLRLIYNFMVEKTPEEYMEFVKNEYGTGGKGFEIDGAKYAVWFDDLGLRIAVGSTAKGGTLVNAFLSWEDVSNRINELLRQGEYAPQAVLDAARQNALQEHAQTLAYMERDLADGVAEAVFQDTEIFRGGFPELTDRLAGLLDDTDFLTDLNERLSALGEAYVEDKDLMRMHFYKPDKVAALFQQFAKPYQNYSARDGFHWNEYKKFITEDEINAYFTRGSNYSDSRLAIYSFFLNHEDKKERADFLKDHYGIGGSSHALCGADDSHEDHDGRGIVLERGSYGSPYASVHLNWNQAAGRINQLIRDSEYLKPADYSRMPAYERERMAMRVMSAQAIAEQLNSENVLAPSEYKRLCGLNYHSGFKAGTHAKWQAIQVLRILKNEVYTGTMVQGRRQKINYKIKKIRDVEESGWIRVPNMHEAIIPQKLFDTVQEVLKLDTCASKGQQTVNLFSGIVRCGGCGQNMVRRTVSKNGKKYIYLHCVTNHNGLGCSSHLISESKLEEVVLAALQGKIQQISGLEHRLDEINEIPKNERRLKSVEEHLKMLEQEEQKYQTLRRQLYEDMSSGIVSKEEYKEFSHSFNEKVEAIRKAKAEMNRQRDCLNNLDVEHLPWIEDFKSYQNLTSLNRRVLVELVESITVYDKEHIHIQYRFDQEIRNVLEYCSSVPAAETEESAV